MRNRFPFAAGALLVIGLTVPLAVAMPANSGLHVLPLGLDGLHWGMPLDDAERVFPALTFAPNGLNNFSAAHFAFFGCTFRLDLRVMDDRLDLVRLFSEGDIQPCQDEAVRELRDHYGPDAAVVYAGDGSNVPRFDYGQWRGAVTSGSYDTQGGAIRALFVPTAAQSAREVEAGRQRAYRCSQSVTAEFIPVPLPDGTSPPTIIPSPGLSCDYPDTSIEGTVVLTVHVLADGSSGSTRVVTPNRLSNAAINLIGLKRIRFRPAMRDGKPVAADGQVTVTFRITHCEPFNTHAWCHFGDRDAYYSWLAQQAPLGEQEQDQIAEAVLKYPYSHDTYLSANRNFGLYLRVRGKDPSPEFLARISAVTGIDFKLGSTIPMERVPTGAVVLTGQNMQVGVGEFTIIEPNIAHGGAGGYCGALCAGGSDITVEKRNGVWEVTSFTLGTVM